MVKTYTYKNVTWIDLENPNREDVRELMKKYDIHPLAAEELILPSNRAKVDRYADYLYLILHFPAWKHSHKETTQEIDFIIGKKHIVTARYDSIDPLHKFSKMFEVNSVLDHNGLLGEHPGYMFYYMMREIYHSLADELDSVRDSFVDIEKKTFGGNEREMVFEISNISRELLSFKHSLSLHKEIISSFALSAKKLFGPEFEHYTQSLEGDYLKVEKMIHSLSESLGEMRSTNNSLLETKQNKIMLTFTSVTIVSSFINIMASWFLLEAPDNPILKAQSHGFWIAGGVMAVLALFIGSIMWAKRWL
jgi:magnesium transporter